MECPIIAHGIPPNSLICSFHDYFSVFQVFCTSEGKGWGLRTLEDLPKGAFVCEYVGEILTNTELFERNTESKKSGKHTYSVLLDADWGSGLLKNEEALCLDATYFGNVARFINHRYMLKPQPHCGLSLSICIFLFIFLTLHTSFN